MAWHTVAPGAELPESMPAQERAAMRICQRLVLAKEVRWGNMPSFLMRFGADPGNDASVSLTVKELNLEEHAMRAVDELNAFAETMRVPGPPASQRGVALFSEAMAVAPGTVLPRGEQLREFFDDQVASGVAHFLAVVGVMSSGWQFYIKRTRPDPTAKVTVVEPGQPWPEVPEVLGVLVEIDQRLAGSR